MYNITLVCNLGLSTSMVVQKMQEAAKKLSIAAEIQAVPESNIAKVASKTNVILLGPQVSYKLDEFKKKYEELGIKVAVVNGTDYAMMNGEKVLKFAIGLIER